MPHDSFTFIISAVVAWPSLYLVSMEGYERGKPTNFALLGLSMYWLGLIRRIVTSLNCQLYNFLHPVVPSRSLVCHLKLSNSFSFLVAGSLWMQSCSLWWGSPGHWKLSLHFWQSHPGSGISLIQLMLFRGLSYSASSSWSAEYFVL